MRSKAIFLAILALSFSARATPVSSEDAMMIAESWTSRGSSLAPTLGKVAKCATRYETDSGAAFYVVEMYGGGTVVTAADTEMIPILAFSSGTIPPAALDRDGAFWAFLNHTLKLRQKALDPLVCAKGPTVKAAEQFASMSANESEWRTLATADTSLVMATEKYTLKGDNPQDLRVDDLVKSNWSQEGAMAAFTPPEPQGGTVCGCVATALAQLMRYLHHVPTEEDKTGLGIPFPLTQVDVLTPYACTYMDQPHSLRMAGNDGEGLPYDWENMPANIGLAVSEPQWTAIGRLASDVGIMVNMHYRTGGQNQSAASLSLGSAQLIAVMNYSESFWYDPDRETDLTMTDEIGILPKTMFANFDVQRPCLMEIPGHAVITTGYGFENGRPFVCVNFGWGAAKAWCNLPTLGTQKDVMRDAVTGIGYNIFPEVGGMGSGGSDIPYGILSGRVLDVEGNPLEGMEVNIYKSGTIQKPITNSIVSRTSGIWGAILPPGTYNVEVVDEATGRGGTLRGLVLESPRARSGNVVRLSALGNNWGNDIYLGRGPVRVVDTAASTNRYTATIESAVLFAKSIATNENEIVRIEVLGEATMSGVSKIDFPCEIVATNDTPAAATITRLKDASFAVVSNGFLTVSNLVFAGSSETVIAVGSNGVASVSGFVDFGVPFGTAAVQTEEADGLLFAAPLEKGFLLDCKAATGAGEFCAVGSRPTTEEIFEVLTNDAAKIANAYDPNGEMRACVTGTADDYAVSWKIQPVPLAEAVGFYTDKNGGTNTAAHLDRLLENYEIARTSGALDDTCRLVFRRGGKLTRPLTVRDNLKLIGEDDIVLDFEGASSAGFELTDGTLTVSGITFSNYVGNAIFLVNGATAKLELEDTLFAAIRGTNLWSGAVSVQKGAVLTTNTRFDTCKIDKDDSPRKNDGVEFNGGAVYLNGAGCSLSLGDWTVITNCFASKYGGGVYVGKGAEVHLAGRLSVVGNTAKGDGTAMGDGSEEASSLPHDIYLCCNENTVLSVDAVVMGAVGVRWSMSSDTTGYGNKKNYWVASAVNEQMARESEDVFVNDFNSDLIAETAAKETGFGLKWTDAPVGPQPLPEDRKGEASACVTYADGSKKYYLLAYEAIEAAAQDATIEIIGTNGVYLAKDLFVTNNLTLLSTNATWTFERRADCSLKILSGGSLTISNLAVKAVAEKTTKPIFDVIGGSLTLATPSAGFKTSITGVQGTWRNAGAINVWESGTFTMKSGTEISNCKVKDADGEISLGGALLVENGIANLEGGSITGCSASGGGGVFIGSKGQVNVSGDQTVTGNDVNNLSVHAEGQLVLTAPLTGTVGYKEGVGGDKEVFGRVADDFSGTQANMVESARHFQHDLNGETGTVVTNKTEILLVWESAILENETYVSKEGELYGLLKADAPPPPPEPTPPTDIAFKSIVRSGENVWVLVITDRVESCYYRLLQTKDLSQGFTTTGAWEQATSSGAWETNVTVSGSDAYFWKAEGAPSSPVPSNPF